MSRPNLEIVDYRETSLGPLCLRRRELLSQPGTIVTEVTLNHEFLMSSFNTDSERALANRAVELHGGEQLSAIVGGLGLGFTTAELLRHPQVASVDVVEFLQPVIDWLRDGMVPLSEELANADGLKLICADVYALLLAPPEQTFDLVVIDVDHSPDDVLGHQENPFYATAGLRQAKRHLRPGGMLAVWSYAESSAFSDALRESFDHVRVEPVTTFNSLVGHEQTDWLFFATEAE